VHDHGDRYLIEGTPAPIGIRARSQEEAQHRAKELEEADQGRFVVLVEGVRIRGYDAPERAQAAAERSFEVGCHNVRVLDRETGKARRIKRGA
jgi:ribosomal protein L24